jgi:NTP pyrophosphatase (non-canonical NTP hydrolase)
MINFNNKPMASDLQQLFNLVLEAHNKRVSKGLVPPVKFDEESALAFSYHLSEEAMEVVQSFPMRKQWKEKLPVNKEETKSELVDTTIMLIIVCQYLEITADDLFEGIEKKLNTKRKDWIA